MDDQSKKVKTSSVLAFLFMPQFSRSFQHFSFVKPVFMRIVAMVFEQANLLPQNHPATQYGMPGVRKYGFYEMMGEAWYNLRQKNGDAYQWSIFGSVCLMMGCIGVSFVSAAMAIAGMFVTTASAQLFDHPTGEMTDINSIPGAATGTAFNTDVAQAGGHADLGIMILDKLLREGTVGRGGNIQNAFGSLMEVYNSGVLVIAGIMLFWCVLSVVVDTAKTGQLGGGRHNMVWAPIRIVFALALLIPLGSSGFSAGQFGVMKLAEWGSNFGSRGWSAYVDSLGNQTKLLAQYGRANPSSLAVDYTKLWVCRVAYNGLAQQAGTLAAQKIAPKPQTGLLDFGKRSFSFTNNTAPNLCGKVTYSTKNNPALLFAANSPTSDELTKAIAAYKIAIADAYAKLFVANIDDATGDGSLAPKAKALACGFVSQFVHGEGEDIGALGTIPEGCAPSSCGAGVPGSGEFPDQTCLQDMVNTINSGMDGVGNSALGVLNSAVSNMLNAEEARKKGWPAMGAWYHKIEQLNTGVSSMRDAQVSIEGGDAANGGYSTHAAKVAAYLRKYDDWWSNSSTNSALGGSAAGSNVQSDFGMAKQDGSLKSKSIATRGKELLDTITSGGDKINIAFTVVDIVASGIGNFLFDLSDPVDHDVYPLALLSKAGASIQIMSVSLYGSMLVFRVGGAILTGNKLGEILGLGAGFKALIDGPLLTMMGTVAGMLWGASLVLKYYIPILPFIKVVFAVLSWMISVFEAVVMVPIAALAHITTQGDGLAAGGKQAWIVWLNVLLRPILTVIGFIGAMLVLNTFVVYFNSMYASAVMPGMGSNGPDGFFAKLIYTVIYVFIIYTVANSSFKLLDMIPAAMFKYMGGSGDQSFDQDASGSIGKLAGLGGMASEAIGKTKTSKEANKEAGNDKKEQNPGENKPGAGGS